MDEREMVAPAKERAPETTALLRKTCNTRSFSSCSSAFFKVCAVFDA
jgi:hypothetical protein